MSHVLPLSFLLQEMDCRRALTDTPISAAGLNRRRLHRSHIRARPEFFNLRHEYVYEAELARRTKERGCWIPSTDNKFTASLEHFDRHGGRERKVVLNEREFLDVVQEHKYCKRSAPPYNDSVHSLTCTNMELACILGSMQAIRDLN
ncbi:hypothetical protein BV20DRAFT_723296 [Pilatotrama ljubarskyi]|nr:hypothetical protein BV20DRAFT_723296 [Pilatotrama ljubarskyi]